jgi:hypothetical protein
MKVMIRCELFRNRVWHREQIKDLSSTPVATAGDRFIRLLSLSYPDVARFEIVTHRTVSRTLLGLPHVTFQTTLSD